MLSDMNTIILGHLSHIVLESSEREHVVPLGMCSAQIPFNYVSLGFGLGNLASPTSSQSIFFSL